jgi:murein tripeptide amidase MpaA
MRLGFVYTQTNERLWRKNRMPPPPPPATQSCFGVDVNRNWPFMWDANPEGASPNPCSQTYRGVEPGDTPENTGLRTLVNKLRDQQGIKLYIDWHSYGQYILGPWGYNCTLVPERVGEHIQLSRITSEIIRDYGGYDTTFTFGPSCSTLYATTGSSVDYIYGPGKAQWSYTIELRDTGDFGFVLPPEQIRGSAEEQWAGMGAMLQLLDEVFFDGEGPA